MSLKEVKKTPVPYGTSCRAVCPKGAKTQGTPCFCRAVRSWGWGSLPREQADTPCVDHWVPWTVGRQDLLCHDVKPVKLELGVRWCRPQTTRGIPRATLSTLGTTPSTLVVAHRSPGYWGGSRGTPRHLKTGMDSISSASLAPIGVGRPCSEPACGASRAVVAVFLWKWGQQSERSACGAQAETPC